MYLVNKNSYKENKVLIDYFPLHTSFRDEIWRDTKLFNIFFNWFIFARIEKLLPLFMLSSYFGERIGMYFAWLTFYTTWLLYISVPGLFLALCQLFTFQIDQYLVPIYCLIVSLWITLMNQEWKRRETELAHIWNMTTYRKHSRERNDYKYEYTISIETGEATKKSSIRPTVRKIFFSLPMILFGLTLIAVAFIVFRMWGNMSTSYMNSIIVGSINGATVFVLGFIYTYLSSVLTNLENHQYEDEWQNSYIIKIFCFQFVNCYISLFAIAFYDTNLHNLAYTMGSIFIVSQFLTHVGQLSSFYWYDLWKTYIFFKKIAKNTTFSSDDVRRKKNVDLETNFIKFDAVDPVFDYCEMVMQIGYLTMFSSAFPIAPILAFLRNIWDIQGNIL